MLYALVQLSYRILKFQLGRLVRVMLLGVVADHPAMVKVSGFADHNHNVCPCTKCKEKKDSLYAAKALKGGTVDRGDACLKRDARVEDAKA